MIIIAHRGISGRAPENTAAAFERMIDLNVDWLETDIDITRDGRLILIHDDVVDRTTDGEGEVNNFNFEEITALDAGSWFDKKFAAERILTLDALIRFINANHLNVNFELKTKAQDNLRERYLKEVVAAIATLSDDVKVIVSSFDHDLLWDFHKLVPDVQLGMLIEGEAPKDWVETAKAHDVAYVHPDAKFVTPELIADAHANNIGVNVWTVNRVEVMNRMYENGVDAIFSDFVNV